MGSKGTGSAVRRLWSLSEGVLVEAAPDRLVVVSRWGETVVPGPSPEIRQMLLRMTLGPVALRNVATSEAARRRLRAALNLLQGELSGSMEHSLVFRGSGQLIVAVYPTAARAPFRPRVPRPGTAVRLSRHCVLSSDGSVLHSNSPLSAHRVVLHRPAARLVVLLAAPVTVAELAVECRESVSSTAVVVGYLIAAGVAVEVGPQDGADCDPRDGADLASHGRRRVGDRPAAGLTALVATAPLDRRVLKDVVIALPPPEPHPAPVLDTVLAAPPSVEELAGPPGLARVGTLLHRSARVRAIDRPAGGAVEEQYQDETYLFVGTHPELSHAAYVYDAGAHVLVEVSGTSAVIDDALDAARRAVGLHRRPALLLVVTTRPAQRSPASGAVAYASMLVHLGMLQQTLQLVADEIGLATRLLSTDAADVLIDRALLRGCPPETSIAKMIIGRRLT